MIIFPLPAQQDTGPGTSDRHQAVGTERPGVGMVGYICRPKTPGMLLSQAVKLSFDCRPLSSLPGSSVPPLQLGRSLWLVSPIPLPPEVAKGMIFF